MAHITADRVRQTSTSTGTGSIVLSGSITGFRDFSAVLAVNDTFWYTIASYPGSEWEVGLGTYTSASTFTRTTVLSSSNAGAAVTFSAGTKEVFITAAASKFLQADAAGSYGSFTAGTITAALTGNASTATTLATSRTLWGQSFTGAANVTGSLTSVGDITGTAGVTLTATSATLALAATGANSITASTNGSSRFAINGTGNVVIGATPVAGYSLLVNKSITGGTTSIALMNNGEIQNDVTAAAWLFRSSPSVVASAFTLPSLAHFSAVPGVLGASSIVTNEYGALLQSTMVNATNTYGVSSNIVAQVAGGTAAATATSISQTTTTVTVTATAHGFVTGQYVTVAATANATSLVSGAWVTILTVGTTNFTLIGAASNTVGVSFTATGVGTGTGTVTLNAQGSGKNITVVDANTFTYTTTSATYTAITLLTGTITPATRWNIYAGGTAPNYFAGAVGIGTTSLANVNLRLGKTMTGSTTAYGIYNAGFVQTDVTSSAVYNQTVVGSVGALTNIIHYYSQQGSLGGALTNQYGNYSHASLIGATNNYAFYADNTAAITTGKTAYGFYSANNTATGGGTTWNFYANGTAPNYFAGNVGIGSTAQIAKLDIGGQTADSVQAIFTRGVSDSNFQIRTVSGVAGSVANTLIGKFGLVYAGTGDAATINFYRGSGTQDSSLTINTNAAERMRIDSSGNVTPGVTNTQTLGSSSLLWSNVYATTFTGALSGNASTATSATSASTLTTARNINGVSFNGSADITITAAAGTLTGTALNSTVVTASIATNAPAQVSGVGTTLSLTGGNSSAAAGGAVSINGGTGFTNFKGGNITIASGAGSGAGYNGSSVSITAGNSNITSDTTGTGSVTITAGNSLGATSTGGSITLIAGTGTTAGGAFIVQTSSTTAAQAEAFRVANTGALLFGGTGATASGYGTSGQVLTSNGNASPSWQSASTVAAAGTLTGTTLNSTVVTASIATNAPSSVAGAGTTLSLTGGASSGAAGGAVSISGGAGASGFKGGNITITAGAGGTSGFNGSSVSITAGNSNIASDTTGTGSVTLTAGNSLGATSTGGSITLVAGTGTTAGGAFVVKTSTTTAAQAEVFRIANTGNVTPGTTNTQTLGSASLLWSNVYATTFTGNATTATALATSRTLWGQGFTGAANVTGSLTSVGDITGTGAVTLTATAGTLALAATGANIITATTNGTERIRIFSSGGVSIGATSDPGSAGLRLGRMDSSAEGGQIDFCRAGDNAVSWSIDAFGSGTTNAGSLRIVDTTLAVVRASIDSAGVFSFNSGYGSAAPVYGCRAWVNFDGTAAGTFPGGTTTVTRTGGSTTCSCTTTNPHGLITGNVIYASFSTVISPPYIPAGSYSVTVTGANTFTFVNTQTTAITSGTLVISVNNIRGDGNVSCVADEGVGVYLINFSTAMPDTNYAMVASVGMGRNPNSTGNGRDNDENPFIGEQTVYYARVYVEAADDTAGDKTYVSVAFFR